MDTAKQPVRQPYPSTHTGEVEFDLSEMFDEDEMFEINEMFDAVEEEDEDVIKRPSHYTRWLIEPIEFIMRNGMEFWRGNIIKYVCRAGFKLYPGKDAVESEITDLEKAIRYCEMRINQLKGDTVL